MKYGKRVLDFLMRFPWFRALLQDWMIEKVQQNRTVNQSPPVAGVITDAAQPSDDSDANAVVVHSDAPHRNRFAWLRRLSLPRIRVSRRIIVGAVMIAAIAVAVFLIATSGLFQPAGPADLSSFAGPIEVNASPYTLRGEVTISTNGTFRLSVGADSGSIILSDAVESAILGQTTWTITSGGITDADGNQLRFNNGTLRGTIDGTQVTITPQ